MRTKLAKIFLVATMGLFSVSANAFSIEPYLGYADGDFDGQAALGARVGYSFAVVSAGLQLNYLTDSEAIIGGAYVMASLPLVARVWAGYDFFSDYSNSTLDGTGIFAGVGFGFLPLVSLNVEYHKQDFGTVAGVDTSSDLLLFSVSLPL